MYLSAISYQPMSVSRNLKQQNSTVNFNAAKLPTYLMQERAVKKETIDSLRREIDLIRNKEKNPENPAKEIDELTKKVVSIINDFNRTINNYVHANYKDIGDYVAFHLH